MGIVHRDVKPANVMLDEKGRPHLMDFGLAHRHDTAEKLTQDGAILGTPAYMAPEQAAGHSGAAQPASDQYSLGVVLYEPRGRTPFSGPPPILIFNAIHREPAPPRQVQPRVPRDLETICLKALAKRPGERYARCQAMADDLRRWLEGEPIQARRLGPVERAARWCGRNPVVAGLVAAVALLLVAGTALSSTPTMS
jgi:serine/threonine-protein kinase